MAQAGSRTTAMLVRLLSCDRGLPASVAAISAVENVQLEPITSSHIIAQNVAGEIVERSKVVRYPAVHAYCERVSNTLKEKFRVFSGKCHMAVEVRVSQDRMEGLDRLLHLYVDAVVKVLDESRGDWGEGAYYTGGYEIQFGPVRQGGKNLIQTAKVTFDVDVSI